MIPAYKFIEALAIFYLFLQATFILAHDEDIRYPQVPVCAPVSPLAAATQGSHSAGIKGDQGVPGKRGPIGKTGRGIPGIKGSSGIQGQKGMDGTKGNKGKKGYPGHPWGTGGCPGVTFHLPRDNQVTDYIRYRGYVPQMKEATACAWIETTDYDNHAAVWSYSVDSPGSTNEWFLAFITPSVVRLARLHGLDFTIPRLTGIQKLHLCSWFTSIPTTRVALYLNGTEVRIGGLSISKLNGGGTLLLGQEQDGVNAGGLDASQAFSGNITNFMIWPRILTDQEISNIARNCDCPWDYAVAMTLDKAEMHGAADYSVPDECPTL